MNAIQKAHILKMELDTLRPISVENEQRIMQKFRLDWNYHSNNLEGNSLTYGETKALILFGITAQGKPFKDHLEMTGHNEAVEWIIEVVKEDRPLTQTFIRELHALLLKEPYQVDAITPAGKPTKKWVEVGVYKSTANHVKTRTGEIFRFATPEETPAKMQDLIDWFSEKREENDYDAILTAIEFHYRFIRIHPFDDGNGRTARILMNFILMQGGFPPVIIKTQEKQQYIAALEQADAGIFEPFTKYIADNLCKSLELIIKGAKGESVEEEDDIDKEIRLLDYKIRTSKTNENIRSPELIIRFSEEVLKKILERMADAILVFSKYFYYQIIEISSDNRGLKREGFISKEDFVAKIIYIIIEQNDLLTQLTISYILSKSRYEPFENNTIEFWLSINMQEGFVTLTSHDYKSTFLYNDIIEETELNKFGKAIKKEGLNKLKSFI